MKFVKAAMDKSKLRRKLSFKDNYHCASTLNKLKCKNCKVYMSSSPVYSFEDGTNLCGGCYQTESNEFKEMKHIRNNLYATIAKEIDFPCQLCTEEGCTQTIHFREWFKQHFGYCSPIKCPVAEDEFQGTINQLQDHLKSQHQDILSDKNTYSFIISSKSTFNNATTIANMDSVQQKKHCCTIHMNGALKVLRNIFHLQGRVFVVTVEAAYNRIHSNWELGVAVNEITHKQCTEKFTLTFINEPNFVLTRECQINTYVSDICVYSKSCLIQNLGSLYAMCTEAEVVCTISLDI